MIVAKRKPIEEIIQELEGYPRILIAGCNECVTVCEAGGRRRLRCWALPCAWPS